MLSGRRALDTGARLFPGVCQKLPRSFPEASRCRQIAKIWLQKAPGQDLAENGRLLIVPEGGFNCGPEAAKLPKSGFKRLPARTLTEAFRGLTLPKRRWKLQKSKKKVQVTKTGVRLDASDRENLSLKNACALVFSGRRALDTGARRFPGDLFWHFRTAERVLELKVCLQKGLLNRTKIQKLKAPNGGDFRTKKCSFYRVQRSKPSKRRFGDVHKSALQRIPSFAPLPNTFCLGSQPHALLGFTYVHIHSTETPLTWHMMEATKTWCTELC